MKLLVIDDDPGIATIVESLVDRSAVEVASAATAAEGWAALERSPVDVLVLDNRLPDAKGLDLLTRSRQLDPRLPENTLDAALIVDAYHEMEQPVVLLRNLARSLKPTGRVGIVNYTKEGGGPGPPLEDRVDADRVIRDAAAAGLRLVARPNFLRYEYMLVFEKAPATD